MSGVARRTVVSAAGAAGLAAALAACGGSGTEDKGTEGQAGATLARTGDIPVGGGKVIAGQGLVITQPKAGEFKAFSSKCTHAGCAVSGVKDGMIVCPCHQSHFDASDGSVKSGPATSPLPPTPIQVVGDEISLG
ncbi:Rieske (2Fe-2S) protein [Streptomyces gardneri]|uniref:Rieske (2Fe-2S) protein n=1 Tax=Streptomyces gardneri TaxID=66892 RepID=UPI0006E33562|nr:Rieske (2Fe-2S) protein [Streptomyces gardneri]QPK44316.1 Rieske (2Fe-2S) protein [Streptomyces gardneri]WRK35607.1 Rieske (2Fe-2S) protein [Streptomyces venezuelae]